MKHCLVVISVAAMIAGAAAQEQSQQPATMGGPQTNLAQRSQGPTYSDMYCSGFITSPPASAANYVVGGWESLDSSRFATGDYIYIAGPVLQEGAEYSVVREQKDPNHAEAYRGQYRQLSALGSFYADLGRVKIINRRNNVNVAQVVFSCEPIVAGDVLMPFVEREQLKYRRPLPMDRFSTANGKIVGRIVLAKDFDQLLGNGRKIYLNVGSQNGIKPGDYVRVVVSGDALKHVEIDALSGKAPLGEDTQRHPASMNSYGTGPHVDLKEFPRRTIAEAMVLNVSNKTSTAIITYSLDEVKVGEDVELEDVVPEPPPPPPPPALPPQISCTARPSTVRSGESATIACAAASPDDRPVTVAFAADRGRVSGNGSNGMLDTTGATPGPITVTATVSDDRNLTASATAAVNVVAAPAPTGASKAGDITFRPKSARVDNKAKAILDDMALRLQRETDARLTVAGLGDTATPAGTRLADARAENVKAYLTKEKGIDPARVSTKSGQGGDLAELWWVPAGATPPQ